jgi:DNA-binding XRE family transcriptional regulator
MPPKRLSLPSMTDRPDPDRVRDLRRSLGMSGARFAEWCGVSQRSVRAWEATAGGPGHYYPTPERWTLLLMKASDDSKRKGNPTTRRTRSDRKN